MARLLFRDVTTTDTGLVVTEKFDDGTVLVDGKPVEATPPPAPKKPAKKPAASE